MASTATTSAALEHDADPSVPTVSVPDVGDAGEGGKLKMIVQLVKKCLGVKDIASMYVSRAFCSLYRHWRVFGMGRSGSDAGLAEAGLLSCWVRRGCATEDRTYDVQLTAVPRSSRLYCSAAVLPVDVRDSFD